MAETFHWIKLRLVCNATEREELLLEIMEELASGAEVSISRVQGHHGNPIAVMEAELSRNRDIRAFFPKLGPAIAAELREEMDSRLDEDCSFYFRLDKQEAVQGEWRIALHGDVISVTAKVVAHPARMDIAAANLDAFLQACAGTASD